MTHSIQTLAIIATVTGNKSAPAVINSLCSALLSRTAKTCGKNGIGGLAYVKETTAHFHSKEGKSTSYAAKGALAAIDVLSKQGKAIGLEIFEGKKPSLDLIALSAEVMQAYNDAVQSAKDKKAEGKAKKEAEQSNNDALTEEALTVASNEANGVTVTHAIQVLADEYVMINDEPVLFADLIALYVTAQAKALIDATAEQQTPSKSKAKKAVNS